MNELPTMTPDQMAELAARLWELRKAYLGTFSEHNEADIRLSADLDSAANLIAGMAQRVPLSEEQIHAIVREHGYYIIGPLKFVRFIEQAHGIRSEK